MENEIIHSRVTRRNFLYLMGMATLAITVPACQKKSSIPITLTPEIPTPYPATPEPLIPTELMPLIDDIKSFRSVFKLTELPTGLLPENIKVAKLVKWEGTPPSFTNGLQGSKDEEYGTSAEKTLKTVFGENITRLVFSIKHGSEYLLCFNPGDRTIYSNTNYEKAFDLTYNSYSLKHYFPYLVVHEGTHGVDPYLASNNMYPLDVLIKVTHGKWRTLTQALSYGGRVYETDMFDQINKSLGELVSGYYAQDNSLSGLVDLRGYGFIQKSIEKWQGFNENTGRDIFYNILSDDIQMSGRFLDDYTKIVEDNLLEIFAGFVQYTFESPSKFQANEDVIAGVTEVISAIQGKPIDLGQIRSLR